jgi:hypothetical protein
MANTARSVFEKWPFSCCFSSSEKDSTLAEEEKAVEREWNEEGGEPGPLITQSAWQAINKTSWATTLHAVASPIHQNVFKMMLEIP